MALSKTEEREQAKFSNAPQPISGKRGATIMGPTNPSREAREPGHTGAAARGPRHHGKPEMVLRRQPHAFGGRGLGAADDGTRITQRHEIAGVNMRLTPGGVRELHWHKAAEWAYMLKGRARITAVDQEAANFSDDVGEGDLWNFPAGIPHSIQGLEPEGCEFLLVFDDGNFSEEATLFAQRLVRSYSERGSGQELRRAGERF